MKSLYDVVKQTINMESTTIDNGETINKDDVIPATSQEDSPTINLETVGLLGAGLLVKRYLGSKK